MYVIYGKQKKTKFFFPVNVDLAGELVSTIAKATHFYSKDEADECCKSLNKDMINYVFKVDEVFFYFDDVDEKNEF